jgi:hypothetical protein
MVLKQKAQVEGKNLSYGLKEVHEE